MKNYNVTIHNIDYDISQPNDGLLTLPFSFRFKAQINDDITQENLDREILNLSAELITSRTGLCHHGFDIDYKLID